MECDDVLRQIFCHLRLLALVRCRSVLKHWNSIITDPKFHAEYLRSPYRPSRPQCVGYFLYTTRTDFGDKGKPVRFYGDVSGRELIAGFSAYSSRSKRRFICSSNGILLCYSLVENLYRPAIDAMCMLGLKFYVCNPMTKKWKRIDSQPSSAVATVGFHCREPSGEDGVRYEYEIVCVFLPVSRGSLSTPHNAMVKIYSSRTRSWSMPLERPLQITWNNSKYSSMVIRGVYYWLDDQGHFLIYDPARNCLELGPVPPDEEQRIQEGKVWVSMDESNDGELVLYVGDNDQFRVWVHADAGDDEIPPVWQMKHAVDFAALTVQCQTDGDANRFLKQPRAMQMPGNPGKAIVGTKGLRVYFYDFESGNLQTPDGGRANCLGMNYNYFYCPYHIPRWYYSF